MSIKKKVDKIKSNWYREGEIQIPINRLVNFLEKGDIIYGHAGLPVSGNYVGYKVTHVAHWGVWAVCSD